MRKSPWLATTLACSLAVVGTACHGDFMLYHQCDMGFTYTPDWDKWGLDLQHDEPRTCPVEMTNRGDVVYAGGVVVDRATDDFLTANLIQKNSSGALLSNSIDGFSTDSDGEWSAEFHSFYHAGTGSDPCFDSITCKMLSRHPASPGSLPSAEGAIYLTYRQSIPYCGGPNA